MKLIKDEPSIIKDVELFISYVSPYEIYPVIDMFEITSEGINLQNRILTKMQVENIAARLSMEGFAIQRFDLQKEGGIQYGQLTDEGRKFKYFGSISTYFLQKEEYEKKEVRRINRDESVYWIQVWIAVGAVAAALYYLLETLRIQYHLGLPYHVFFR